MVILPGVSGDSAGITMIVMYPSSAFSSEAMLETEPPTCYQSPSLARRYNRSYIRKEDSLVSSLRRRASKLQCGRITTCRSFSLVRSDFLRTWPDNRLQRSQTLVGDSLEMVQPEQRRIYGAFMNILISSLCVSSLMSPRNAYNA